MAKNEISRAVRCALTRRPEMEMNAGGRRRSKLRFVAAGALAGALLVSTPALVNAQSNVDGYVYGTGQPGTEVRIKNPSTGAVRTATVTSTGSFRSPSLPPGRYEVTFTDDSGAAVTREVFVTIGSGASVDTSVDTIVVTGSTVRPVDLTSTEVVTTLTAEQVTQLPVVRDIQQVALLAPGVIQGDGGFTSKSNQPLVSFGGASQGENTYFINGFNVTDFRNFLGGATVPFEFYDQFELRTGGYSAEFGRALGGVVNAVTKRGTNEFTYGVASYYSPDSLTSQRPNSTYIDDEGEIRTRVDNSKDYNAEWEVNFQAGGPIIKDKLFFYGLAVLREVRDDDAVGTTAFSKTTDDSPFFGGKLDWQITDNHAMEYTYLRDETTTDIRNFSYDSDSRQIGSLNSVGARKVGGEAHILRYSGSLTDNLTLSALYGKSERKDISTNADAATGSPCTVVIDARGGQVNPLSCYDASGTGQASSTTDEREAYRLDLTYVAGNHTLRFGYDAENNSSDTQVEYEGGVYWRYVNATPGDVVNGGVVPAGVTQMARERFYSVQGSFEEKLTAFYIEDQWQVTDRLLLSLGLRNETLENFNREGEEFLDFDDQLTPRVGFSFDMFDDGRTKLFGNAGRYTMPIATNTNIRFAGGEFFTEQYYVLEGLNPDDTPIIGAPIGSLNTLSDGSVPVPAQSVDKNIEPMYQDEYILGIQSAITDTTTVGFKVTHRDLVRAVEDSAFVDANNNFYYFLFNPGSSVTLANADGSYTTLTAEELGYPEAKRKYWAAELSFDTQIASVLRMGGSYTWSHSYGNFEGVFQSDVQQDDAGITITFDTPGLAMFTNGNLPNDRRHIFKLFGTYSPIQDLLFTFNASAYSGRPKNARGNCGVLDPEAYESDCFVVQGEPRPRGSEGRLPWTYNVDLGVRYSPTIGLGKLTVGMDVFNIFNFDTETRIQEVAQQPGGDTAPLDPSYGIPVYFQNPRSVRLTARWDF